MASNGEKPEFRALEELEDAVRQMSAELAAWRKRAHAAESGVPDSDSAAVRARVVELEGENEELRHRIQHAQNRVTDLLMRLQFLEEQAASGDVPR